METKLYSAQVFEHSAPSIGQFMYYSKLFFPLPIVVEQGTDTTPTSYYALCAFTYLTAMVSSNKALLWVNYPTQVIGKSCKPIPVMILGK